MKTPEYRFPPGMSLEEIEKALEFRAKHPRFIWFAEWFLACFGWMLNLTPQRSGQ
jgi:hypothetical protein